MPPNASTAWIAFLRARGAEVTDEEATIPYDATAAVPLTMTVYPGSRGLSLKITSRCPHLTAEKTCDIHGTDAYPTICATYPTVHDYLSFVKGPDGAGCSYDIVADAVEEA